MVYQSWGSATCCGYRVDRFPQWSQKSEQKVPGSPASVGNTENDPQLKQSKQVAKLCSPIRNPVINKFRRWKKTDMIGYVWNISH